MKRFFQARPSESTRNAGFPELALLAVALSFGVIAWEHLLHGWLTDAGHAEAGGSLHTLFDGTLTLPLAFLGVLAASWLARRLLVDRIVVQAALIAGALTLLLIPGTMLHGFIEGHPDPEAEAAATESVHAGHEHAGSMSTAPAAGLEDREDLPGVIEHGMRDALLSVPASFLLALLGLTAVGGLASRRSTPRPNRRREELIGCERVQPAAQDLIVPIRHGAKRFSDAAALQVSGLSKAYGPVPALRDVSFIMDPGTATALLGPNGAGKTTTFKCILGVTPFEGSIEVTGLSVQHAGKEVRRRIGYLPQTPAFSPTDTCEQALAFLAELRQVDVHRVLPLLEQVNLQAQRHTRVANLSGGMRQRLALAAALLSDPALLLLDEPTANLDIESREQFQHLLKELKSRGKTILISTHFLHTVDEVTDRVLLLDDGRVVFDGSLAVFQSTEDPQRVEMTPHKLSVGRLAPDTFALESARGAR